MIDLSVSLIPCNSFSYGSSREVGSLSARAYMDL